MTPANPSLIERLEAAEGGSRELDGEVMRAFGFVWNLDFGSSWWGLCNDKSHVGRIYDHAARPTTSLDCALTVADRFGVRPSYAFLWSTKGFSPDITISQLAMRTVVHVLRALADGREG